MPKQGGRPMLYNEPLIQVHLLLPQSLFEMLEDVRYGERRPRTDIVRSALAEYLNWTPKAETQE